MTNNSVFLQQVNDGYTNFLNAENEIVKLPRTGIFLCQNGEVDCTLDGKNYNIVAHTMITYFAFSELKINRRSSDLKGIIIGGDLEAIQPLLYKISDFNGLFSIRSNPFVALPPEQERNMLMYASLIGDVLDRLNGNTEPEEEHVQPIKEIRMLQLEMLGNSMMLNIVSCYTRIDLQSKLTDRKEDILMRFVSLLYKSFKEEHEVAYYAEQQFLTSRYFSAIIKDKSGKTPSQWIATALLVEAKNKLRQSSMTIKEISEYLCFPNQSYFGKWFKNLTGISPLEYKNGKKETFVTDDEFSDMVRRGASFVNSKIETAKTSKN